MEHQRNFIGGVWTAAAAGGVYPIFNPARPQEQLGCFARSGEEDADAAVAAAASAAPEWRATPGPRRGALLYRFAQLLEESKSELARIVTLEQGKALNESLGEVGRAVVEARYMAGEASRPTGETYPSERAQFTAETVREPLGVVAAICPWNFPVVTPVRKAAPALAYGNTVVLKPASLTPWSAVFLAGLFEKAEFPPGVVNVLTGPGSAVGDAIVADARVRGITFTGSTVIGRRVAEGAARRLVPAQLELGGKNPAIVIDCADLAGAAAEITSAAFLCSGQRCTALSRVIVAGRQAGELVDHLRALVNAIRTGDGLAEGTTMGPLVSRAQFDTVAGYVRKGIDEGCRVVCGGAPLTSDPDREGYFFAPTLFDDVDPGSPLASEEIFGPVLPVIRVRDEQEALRVANSTRYGLAASVFTSRPDVAHRFASQIESGMVHLNHGTASQAHVPFGGRKESGAGAFSIGPTARDFFTSVKVIYTKWM